MIAKITLAASDNLTNYNFGETPAGTVSGFVYVDANNDGAKDASEAGIAGVTITLTGTDTNGMTVALTHRHRRRRQLQLYGSYAQQRGRLHDHGNPAGQSGRQDDDPLRPARHGGGLEAGLDGRSGHDHQSRRRRRGKSPQQ